MHFSVILCVSFVLFVSLDLRTRYCYNYFIRHDTLDLNRRAPGRKLGKDHLER